MTTLQAQQSVPTSFTSDVDISRLTHDDDTYKLSAADAARPKKHAACDECRQRKLKCSGEPTGCSRCVKHGIECHYSEQKQMGRPRKRQKIDEIGSTNSTPPSSAPLPVYSGRDFSRSRYPEPPHVSTFETPIDPSLADIDQERAEFSNICTGPIAQSIRDARDISTFERQVAQYEGLSTSGSLRDDQPDALGNSGVYPLDILQWPDFSNTSLPQLMIDSEPGTNRSSIIDTSPAYTGWSDATSLHDPDIDPAALRSLPSAPACPCLPNLYLTLSTLHTLSTFPTSSQTIETLLAAHRTCHSVIYCPICPQKFQTGSQNLMLGCTLLNILADQWHRIRRASAEDIKIGFSSSVRSSSESNGSSFMTTKEGNKWRHLCHRIIRAYVFGDVQAPEGLPMGVQIPLHSSSDVQKDRTELGLQVYQAGVTDNNGVIDNSEVQQTRKGFIPAHLPLKALVKALERRQRQWHNLDEPTDEFPDTCDNEYTALYAKAYHESPAHKDKKNRNITDDGKGSHISDTTQDQVSKSATYQDKIKTMSKMKVKLKPNTHDNVRDGAGQSANGNDDASEELLHNGDVVVQDKTDSDTQRHKNGEHMLCLMIVKHSMVILDALDEDTRAVLNSAGASSSSTTTTTTSTTAFATPTTSLENLSGINILDF